MKENASEAHILIPYWMVTATKLTLNMYQGANIIAVNINYLIFDGVADHSRSLHAEQAQSAIYPGNRLNGAYTLEPTYMDIGKIGEL